MKTDFIPIWAKKLNTTEDELKKKFELAKEEMKSYFPNQSEETIFEKAKMKLKVDYKKRFLSSATSFVGIVISSDKSRDPFAKIKQNQLDRYLKAKEQADQTGDQSLIQKEIDAKVVKIDVKTGEVIPLWPKLKKDGTKSKMAGKEFETEERSQVQTVYGIAAKEGTEDAKGFVLELKGLSCNQELHEGKIVNFRAMNKTQPTDSLLQLTTYATEFVPTESKYFEEGLEKIGLTGMITTFFKDNIATWEDVKNWVMEKTDNPEKETVPEKFSKGIMVLVDSLCVYQNFTPDQKNRIKINICSTDDDADDITVLCLADEKLEKSIDFAHNSKVVAIGRPWLPKPREEDEMPNLLLMTTGMFAYDDWKIPRVEGIMPLKPENVTSSQETKPEEKTEETPQEKKQETGKPKTSLAQEQW